MSAVVVCSPEGWTYRAILPCRKCKRRTRHLVTSYVWYGPTGRCLAHDPIRVPYSRKASPERTRSAWDQAMTRAEAHAGVVAAAMAEIDAEGRSIESGWA